MATFETSGDVRFCAALGGRADIDLRQWRPYLQLLFFVVRQTKTEKRRLEMRENAGGRRTRDTVLGQIRSLGARTNGQPPGPSVMM